MKSASMEIPILSTYLLAGVAAAQIATGLHTGASKEGQAGKGMMAGGMRRMLTPRLGASPAHPITS